MNEILNLIELQVNKNCRIRYVRIFLCFNPISIAMSDFINIQIKDLRKSTKIAKWWKMFCKCVTLDKCKWCRLFPRQSFVEVVKNNVIMNRRCFGSTEISSTPFQFLYLMFISYGSSQFKYFLIKLELLFVLYSIWSYIGLVKMLVELPVHDSYWFLLKPLINQLY